MLLPPQGLLFLLVGMGFFRFLVTARISLLFRTGTLKGALLSVGIRRADARLRLWPYALQPSAGLVPCVATWQKRVFFTAAYVLYRLNFVLRFLPFACLV